MNVGHPLLSLENLLDIFHTLKQLQRVSSEKGVGEKERGRGKRGNRAKSHEQCLLSCQSWHLSAEPLHRGGPHSGRTPSLNPRTHRPWAAGSCRRDLRPPTQATAVACSLRSARPLRATRCALVPGDPRPAEARQRAGGITELGARFAFCSSLRRGFIVCRAFWGWGESCASATAAAAGAAVASAARRAGRGWEWMRSCLPRQRLGLPFGRFPPEPAGCPPEGHLHHGLT